MRRPSRLSVLRPPDNARQMGAFGSSRAELFAEIDRPKLGELPDQPYVFARWKRCRVAPDYHVEVDGHWYSTPYRLVRELVDVRIADNTVEIFHKGQRIASHVPSVTGPCATWPSAQGCA